MKIENQYETESRYVLELIKMNITAKGIRTGRNREGWEVHNDGAEALRRGQIKVKKLSGCGTRN